MARTRGTLLDRLRYELSLDTDPLEEGERKARGIFGRISSAATAAGQSILTGFGMGVGMGVERLAEGAVRAMGQVFRATARFEQTMGEVSTIVDTSTTSMDELNAAILEMSENVPQDPDTLGAGLYQTISAGITDAGEALEFLDVAARTAIAGVTDTATAVDGLTSVLNAYGLSADDATTISDQMFKTVELGKCIAGESRVLLADGTYRRIDQLHSGVEVLAYDGERFVPAVAEWWDQGKQETIRVVTRYGRTIVTTAEHPYLTPDGWRRVDQLAVGDEIALPASLPVFGEGVESMGGTGGWVTEPNPSTEWFRSPGLGGCRAEDAFIPEECFRWTRENLALLLRGMFSTDGWIAISKRQKGGYAASIGFASASERLTRDVAHLLLRFGVVARVRFKPNAYSWSVDILRMGDVERFLDRIGLLKDSEKVEKARDIIAKARAGNQRWRITDEQAVHFDRIVSLEPAGVRSVYDLTVPGYRNFVAEDILVHNTTFPELAHSIGMVVPLAAGLGIESEELLASIATLTKQGMQTTRAMQYLRGALANILKPAGEAEKVAQQLGIRFDAATMKSMGFGKFIQMVTKAAKGNQEQMAKLFGSVEALNAVLALASERGMADFDATLADLQNSAGATSVAFGKMNRTFTNQVQILRNKLQVAFINLGEKILPKVVSAMEYFTSTAMARATRRFQDLQQQIRQSESGTLRLADRYDELAEEIETITLRGDDATAQQNELNSVTEELARIAPKAVSAYNQYGDALRINTGYLREAHEEEVKRLRIMQQDIYGKATRDIGNYSDMIAEATRELEKYRAMQQAGQEWTTETTPGAAFAGGGRMKNVADEAERLGRSIELYRQRLVEAIETARRFGLTSEELSDLVTRYDELAQATGRTEEENVELAKIVANIKALGLGIYDEKSHDLDRQRFEDILVWLQRIEKAGEEIPATQARVIGAVKSRLDALRASGREATAEYEALVRVQEKVEDWKPGDESLTVRVLTEGVEAFDQLPPEEQTVLLNVVLGEQEALQVLDELVSPKDVLLNVLVENPEALERFEALQDEDRAAVLNILLGEQKALEVLASVDTSREIRLDVLLQDSEVAERLETLTRQDLTTVLNILLGEQGALALLEEAQRPKDTLLTVLMQNPEALERIEDLTGEDRRVVLSLLTPGAEEALKLTGEQEKAIERLMKTVQEAEGTKAELALAELTRLQDQIDAEAHATEEYVSAAGERITYGELFRRAKIELEKQLTEDQRKEERERAAHEVEMKRRTLESYRELLGSQLEATRRSGDKQTAEHQQLEVEIRKIDREIVEEAHRTAQQEITAREGVLAVYRSTAAAVTEERLRESRHRWDLAERDLEAERRARLETAAAEGATQSELTEIREDYSRKRQALVEQEAADELAVRAEVAEEARAELVGMNEDLQDAIRTRLSAIEGELQTEQGKQHQHRLKLLSEREKLTRDLIALGREVVDADERAQDDRFQALLRFERSLALLGEEGRRGYLDVLREMLDGSGEWADLTEEQLGQVREEIRRVTTAWEAMSSAEKIQREVQILLSGDASQVKNAVDLASFSIGRLADRMGVLDEEAKMVLGSFGDMVTQFASGNWAGGIASGLNMLLNLGRDNARHHEELARAEREAAEHAIKAARAVSGFSDELRGFTLTQMRTTREGLGDPLADLQEMYESWKTAMKNQRRGRGFEPPDTSFEAFASRVGTFGTAFGLTEQEVYRAERLLGDIPLLVQRFGVSSLESIDITQRGGWAAFQTWLDELDEAIGEFAEGPSTDTFQGALDRMLRAMDLSDVEDPTGQLRYFLGMWQQAGRDISELLQYVPEEMREAFRTWAEEGLGLVDPLGEGVEPTGPQWEHLEDTIEGLVDTIETTDANAQERHEEDRELSQQEQDLRRAEAMAKWREARGLTRRPMQQLMEEAAAASSDQLFRLGLSAAGLRQDQEGAAETELEVAELLAKAMDGTADQVFRLGIAARRLAGEEEEGIDVQQLLKEAGEGASEQLTALRFAAFRMAEEEEDVVDVVEAMARAGEGASDQLTALRFAAFKLAEEQEDAIDVEETMAKAAAGVSEQLTALRFAAFKLAEEQENTVDIEEAMAKATEGASDQLTKLRFSAWRLTRFQDEELKKLWEKALAGPLSPQEQAQMRSKFQRFLDEMWVQGIKERAKPVGMSPQEWAQQLAKWRLEGEEEIPESQQIYRSAAKISETQANRLYGVMETIRAHSDQSKRHLSSIDANTGEIVRIGSKVLGSLGGAIDDLEIPAPVVTGALAEAMGSVGNPLYVTDTRAVDKLEALRLALSDLTFEQHTEIGGISVSLESDGTLSEDTINAIIRRVGESIRRDLLGAGLHS